MIDVVDISQSGSGLDLERALRATGFVQIVGHGLDDDTAASLWAAMDEFFALPLETKLAYVVEDPLANRGYRQRGSEALSYSLGKEAPPDLFESFNIGAQRGSLGGADHPLMAPCVWPDEVAGFEQSAIAYLAEMGRISRRLDDLLGAVLGLDDLAGRSTAGPDTMACIRYQTAPDELAARGSSRMGAHSDYTTFTVLNADSVPGLEIFVDGSWLRVIPEAGALMVNTGDLLAMWTNDVWPSTLHRVPLRGDGTDPPLRRSVAYFHYPDLDVWVEPLEHLAESGARYAGVTVEEHLASKLVGPKAMENSGGASTVGDRRL